jgi:hypothetical protein
MIAPVLLLLLAGQAQATLAVTATVVRTEAVITPAGRISYECAQAVCLYTVRSFKRGAI